MRQDKTTMRRMGGLLLEVLVLVFVFAYSYSWSGDFSADDKSANPEKRNSEIVFGNFSIPTTLNDQTFKTKIKSTYIGSAVLSIQPLSLLIADKQGISTPFAPIHIYYSLTTINAP